ncbi:hypothetical protein K439DRAFT_1645660 [Ramaria rubella]|nr:hypothetical protein K439DRAFT_1645660 [Ramaria rubella]
MALGKKPIFPVSIFIDDASANISKQWNKHYCVYMSNRALPRELIDQEFNICFVATLPSVSALELMQGVKESLHDVSADSLPAYDCMEEEECLLLTFPLFMPGDNPMQAEECSHAGLTANKFCQTCTVGGPQVFKRSDEGYMSLFEDAIANTIINELVALGYKLQKKYKSVPGRAVHVKHALAAELQRLQEGLNIHMDTPTEILHTILLGVVKYFWGQTVFVIVKLKQLDRLQVWLHSLSGSLIGKHFKTLVQILPYAIYDMVSSDVLEAWILLGRLVVLLWHTEIDVLDTYLQELENTIQAFLTVTAKTAPTIIQTKPKFHFLLHLPMFIWRFSAALLFSTECYESFNSVFHLTMVHSN